MNAIELIQREREEQVEKHGFDAAHDDAHQKGEIKQAALAILIEHHNYWPWQMSHFRKIVAKPRKEKLIIAGALIVAEIERLQRAEVAR